MASNQNVNKVVYAGTTLIDLTGDDVTAASVLSGKKFHLPSGAAATGTIATKTASNLTASGATVTVPAGYYASQATKSVAYSERICWLCIFRYCRQQLCVANRLGDDQSCRNYNANYEQPDYCGRDISDRSADNRRQLKPCGREYQDEYFRC